MKKFTLKITIFLTINVLTATMAMANNTAITSGSWENGANWSSGAAPLATDNVVIPAGISITINASGDVCDDLNIASTASLAISANQSLFIGGNFTNAGTFSTGLGTTLTFNGAANSSITGGGSYSISGTVAMNMGSASTSLDILDANFISGIDAGGKYSFSFLKGIWKMDNGGTLNDCYNSGTTNALTIPFGVVIESDNGTMNLAKNGTMATIGDGITTYGHSNIILSGKLFINGGVVNVAMGQPARSNSGQTLAMGVNLQYTVNGGTPQLYVASGTLNLGSGFNYFSTTDYIDFNMTGGTIVTVLKGSSFMGTFQLNDAVGGKTFMTGGVIELTDASWGNYSDADLGGAKVATTLYSVTGGTIQFGSPATANAGTYFAFQAWPTTNYPNFDFEPGSSKVVQPLNNADFRIYSLTANTNMTFNVGDYFSGNTNKNITIDGNNGAWAFDDEGGFIQGSCTLNFTGSLPQMISSSTLTNDAFNNVVIANTGAGFTSVNGTLTSLTFANTLTVNSGTFTPGTMNTLNITGITTLNGGNLIAPAIINESGNWTNNGGTFTPGTGTLNFVGAGNEAIGGTATTQTFYNVVANLTAGKTLSAVGATRTITTQNLTETSGNIGAPVTLLTVNGNLILSAGTFTSGVTTKVAGDFTNNSGTFVQGGNTVIFNGAVAQTIGGSFPTTFNNLTISNTGSRVILGIAATVASQFAFTSGRLDATNFSLTINSGSTAITGASATSYVITGNGVASATGALILNSIKKNVNNLFPVGTATYYFPATINPGNNTGNSYSAFVYAGATTNGVAGGPAFGAPALAVIENAVWNINRTAGTGTSTLGLNWAASGTTLEGAAFQADGTNIGISQYTTGWQNPIGGGNEATKSASASFGSFSQFLVGQLNYVLPILITDFNAALKNNIVLLSWTASNGENITNFKVQHSNNGADWKQIGSVQATGNNATSDYSFTDENPANGDNYYRLMVQNTDGSYTYSTIRVVALSSIVRISAYPNPTTDIINVSVGNAGSEVSLRLISLSGQILQSTEPGSANGSVVSMNVRNYARGIYMVQVINAGKVLQTISVAVVH